MQPTPLEARIADTIAILAAVDAERRVAEVGQHTSELHGFRILVVEDNRVNQLVTVAQLRQLGCHADIAENGAEALAAVAAREYDAVLMDCHMPELDGFDAAREIRRERGRPGARRLPIVAVTASAMEEDRVQCLAAGMDDCVTKPTRRETLQAALVRYAHDGAVPDSFS